MRAWLRIAAAATWIGCEGLIAVPKVAPPIEPPRPLACGSEQLCVGASGLARLTAAEYEATARAALGTALGAVSFDALPGDGIAASFASNDDSPVNDDMVAQYALMAERIAAAVNASAALGCATGTVSDACLNGFVDRVGNVLFRTVMGAEDREPYRAVFRHIESLSGGADATRITLTAMLASPRFLYHLRVGTPVTATVRAAPGDVVQLTGAELSERLSYFLTGQPPDAELRRAASDGTLDSAEGIALHARRLLADPKADVSMGRFYTQWLGLEGLPTRSFAAQIYPGLEPLRQALYDETHAFGAYVMRESDATLRTLLTANWTVASGPLFSFYGIAAAPMASPARVELPAGQRSGILTHAGFLATHTHDPSTQAVHRGKAIRERFLCQGIPPAPANIDPRINPDPALSPRQRLEAKTSDNTCRACHTLMNPTGFLFEQFEVTGAHRAQVTDPGSGRTFAVDARGSVPSSDIQAPLDGASALGEALSRSTLVDRCVARQWFRYATGRSESEADEPSFEQVYQRYRAAQGNLRELLVGIVQTDSFRLRRSRP